MSPIYQALELFKMVFSLQNISAKTIQDEMNVSRATAYRYMQTLQSVFSLKETEEKGIYQLEKDYKIPDRLKKYEKDFLDYIIKYHSKSLNTNVDDVSPMNPNMIIGDEPVLDKTVKENYEKLHRQINDSCKCSFLYKEHTEPYIVEPYNLLYYHSTQYLLAKHGDTVKTFRLELMKDIKDTGEVYLLKKSLADKYKTQAKTIWYDLNSESENVEITVDADVARYFKGRSLLPAQSIIKELKDGSITVAFHSSSFMEFQLLLLGWFGKFKVVKPQKYADYINTTIEKYQEK